MFLKPYFGMTIGPMINIVGEFVITLSRTASNANVANAIYILVTLRLLQV